MRSPRVLALLLLPVTFGCQMLGGAPLTQPELDPDLVQRGGMLFLDPRISVDGARACATCHPGGGTDGRVYRMGVEVGSGRPGGRDVPALWGLWQRGPYLADGSLGSVAEVLDRMLEVEMRGGDLPPADRRALEAYLLSIPAFDRRRTLSDGTPTEPVTRGALDGFGIYRDQKCTLCHPGPAYMRKGRFDVGTGGKYTVPTLLGVSETAPYGHDGRWSTLEEAVRGVLRGRGQTLSEADLKRLLDYLHLL